MRQLTNEEKKLAEKGIKRLNKELVDAKLSGEYAKKKLEYLKKVWEFEDFSRPLEREKSEENSINAQKQSEADVKLIQEKIKELEKQIKEGVKEVSGTG